MTIKIAITGNIATGKTTVCEILKSMGFKVFESDYEVKKLYNQNDIIYEIRENFINKIPDLFKSGKLDIKKLSNYAFSNKHELHKLEKIIHPHVWSIKKTFIKENSKEKVLFFDIPLLFEKNLHKRYDFVFYTMVDQNIQKKRVLERGNMNVLKFQKILSIQASFSKVYEKFVSLKLDTEKNKTLIKNSIMNFLDKKNLLK